MRRAQEDLLPYTGDLYNAGSLNLYQNDEVNKTA